LGYVLLYVIVFTKILFSKPEIVYIQASQTGYLHQSLFLFIAKVLGCRTIMHFHAKPNLSEIIGRRQLNKILLSRFYIDTLIVLAYSCKTEMQRIGWNKPIYVVPNFIDIADCPDRLSTLSERRYILYIGRMHEVKGIYTILDIAKLIQNEDFLFVGPFESNSTQKEFLRRIGKVRNARWVGPDYGKKKIDLWSQAKCFLLPSDTEVFPVSIIEGWVCGVVPFVTPVGMVPEIIKDGYNGFIINSKKTEETALKIKELLKSEKLQEEMSQRCKIDASKRYTSAAVKRNIIRIITKSYYGKYENV